ncbi:hypothetical protein BKA93DRAFT_811329 [Sparassis latifolia]
MFRTFAVFTLAPFLAGSTPPMLNVYIPPPYRVEPTIMRSSVGRPCGALGAKWVVGAVRVASTFLWMSDLLLLLYRCESLLMVFIPV